MTAKQKAESIHFRLCFHLFLHMYGFVDLATSQVRVLYVRDDTGSQVSLLTLLSSQGVSEELLSYQYAHYHSKSLSWHRNLVFAVRRLLQYGAANHLQSLTPTQVLRNFQTALYTGTVDQKSGLDSSGLYWKRLKAPRVRVLIRLLTEFSEWLAENYGGATLNPLRVASAHERMTSMLAWAHKNKASFLGHTVSEANATWRATLTHSLGKRREPKLHLVEPKAFPDEHFSSLVLRGFIKDRCVADSFLRLNLRDVLITLLGHAGGLRLSEIFHLWVQDVQQHPLNPGSALVRVGHPIEGFVLRKDELTAKWIKCTKSDYLAAEGLLPLTSEIRSSHHVGWKNPTLDGKWYLEVQWFPKQAGELFWTIWQLYLRQLQAMQIEINHPYAWVAERGPNLGGIYNMEHYRRVHTRAVRRIGLPCGIEYGTNVHSHRHAYAKRLASTDVSETIIQRCMHHRSPSSQAVYTQQEAIETTRELNQAEERMKRGERPSPNHLFKKMEEDFRQLIKS